MDDQELTAELLAMMGEQKDLMDRRGAALAGSVPPEVKRVQREVFVRHADRLRQILEDLGWPTVARVGEQAARGAW